MTTTSIFQTKPDFYTKEELLTIDITKKEQTNIRYKNFTQTIWTAGDEDQFSQYKHEVNGQTSIPNINIEKNIFNSIYPLEKEEEIYKDLSAIAVDNTFQYIFHKFKKGIFVKILDNKLKVFLPFSKSNYVNEWENQIQIDPVYENLTSFFKHISEMEGRIFNPKRVNNCIDSWYANNFLLRYEYPLKEGDSNISTIKNMLEELCINRTLPDMEFFINRRDTPLLSKDKTEPYNHIWNTTNMPLKSHSYDKYLPILSMSNTERFADVLIPTYEDWARVQSKENKWFINTSLSYNDNFDTKWEDKKQIAVFRGSSTGCGVTINSNQRLRLAYISHITTPDKDGIPYLDAGITKWNLRPRKIQGEKYLKTINKDSLPFKLVEKLSPQEQSKYKYIINVEGHVSAYRLSLEMNMGSVILLAESKWQMWYKKFLKPYIHYVPIKKDLSDLIQIIKWCRENDDKCKLIAENAKDFYNTYLQKNGIFDYLQKTLINIKTTNGAYLYNYISPLDLQLSIQYKKIRQNVYPETTKTVYDIVEIPKTERNYGLLQGIHWIINMVITTSDFEKVCKEQREIIKNKLSIVKKYKLAGFNLSVKKTNDYKKSKEHIHETFVGLKCLNELSKFIPNFMYIFGMYENKRDKEINVITEYIEGQNMYEYINSEEFEMKEFLFILIQLSLALQVAQKLYGLVHYDITPWNIILKRFSKPKTFDYVIQYDKIIRIETSVIPVIIDYGKSHVVYDDIHYGFVNMYKSSTIQDIISLLLTSIHQISTKKLPKKEFTDLIMLANFISGTQYKKDPFSGSKDLKKFVHNSRKYSTLISSEKYELENRNPYDLFLYIINNFTRHKFSYSIVTDYVNNMNIGSGKQVFNYILCKTHIERLETYTDFFKRIRTCKLPKCSSLIFVYYTIQNIEKILISVYYQMIEFTEKNTLISPEEVIITDVLKYLYKKYYKNLYDEDRIYDIKNNIKIIPPIYTENTFLIPEKILELINSIENKLVVEMVEFKEIVETVLLYNGEYKLPENLKKQYIENFSDILDIKHKNRLVDIKTLIETTRSIYSQNVKYVPDRYIYNTILGKIETMK